MSVSEWRAKTPLLFKEEWTRPKEIDPFLNGSGRGGKTIVLPPRLRLRRSHPSFYKEGSLSIPMPSLLLIQHFADSFGAFRHLAGVAGLRKHAKVVVKDR